MFSCSVCKSSLRSKRSLLHHMKRYHPKPSNQVTEQHDLVDNPSSLEEVHTSVKENLDDVEEQKHKRVKLYPVEESKLRINPKTPVIEHFTAFCIKNVFFEKILSNRNEAQRMFSIEQLLFMEAVQCNGDLDDACRLLEENLNMLLRIVIYVCNN